MIGDGKTFILNELISLLVSEKVTHPRLSLSSKESLIEFMIKKGNERKESQCKFASE
jgi:hypothetical protein